MKLIKTILFSLFFAILFLVCSMGAGALRDGEIEYKVENGEAILTRCNAASETYEIPATAGGYPLTTIGYGSFSGAVKIKKLIIPASVQYLEEQCFRGYCPAEVIFEAPTTFGDMCFYLAEGLKVCTIAEGQKALSVAMFRVSTLEEINLPSTLETVNDEAFRECKSMTYIKLPESVSHIGDRAFFSDTALTGDLYLSDKCTYIGSEAFINCYSLTEFTIMNQDCTIGTNAFKLCMLNLYGRKNSTALNMTKSFPDLHFKCATEADHDYPEIYTRLLEPTSHYYGADIRTCVNCGHNEIVPISKDKENPFSYLVEGSTERLRFRDIVKGSWYENDVIFCYTNGLLLGVTKSTFCPDNTVTRGMFTTVLWRLCGQPATINDGRFTDIKKGAYYEEAMIWANDTGIMMGIGNGKAAPDAPLTRLQAIAMLYRFAGISNMDTTVHGNLSAFRDANQIKISDGTSAFLWGVNHNVISGNNGLLMPNDALSRAQMCALIYRIKKAFCGIAK